LQLEKQLPFAVPELPVLHAVLLSASAMCCNVQTAQALLSLVKAAACAAAHATTFNMMFKHMPRWSDKAAPQMLQRIYCCCATNLPGEDGALLLAGRNKRCMAATSSSESCTICG